VDFFQICLHEHVRGCQHDEVSTGVIALFILESKSAFGPEKNDTPVKSLIVRPLHPTGLFNEVTSEPIQIEVVRILYLISSVKYESCHLMLR